MKKVIINADDFGMSPVFNEKIIDLCEKKFVTSVSVLFGRGINKQEAQVERIITLRKKLNISLGLHFDLDNSSKDYSYDQIKSEIQKQYNLFIKIFGFPPDHLDKHKNIYSGDEAKAMSYFAKDNSIFIKNSKTGLIESYQSQVKTTSKMAISMTSLGYSKTVEFIQDILDEESYEICCHPGEYDPDCASSLNKEREKDYENIIKLQDVLKENGAELISFLDL